MSKIELYTKADVDKLLAQKQDKDSTSQSKDNTNESATIDSINGLQDALDKKASVTHTHQTSDIIGLDEKLKGVGGSDSRIGELSELNTTNKSSIVDAINEVSKSSEAGNDSYTKKTEVEYLCDTTIPFLNKLPNKTGFLTINNYFTTDAITLKKGEALLLDSNDSNKIRVNKVTSSIPVDDNSTFVNITIPEDCKLIFEEDMNVVITRYGSRSCFYRKIVVEEQAVFLSDIEEKASEIYERLSVSHWKEITLSAKYGNRGLGFKSDNSSEYYYISSTNSAYKLSNIVNIKKGQTFIYYPNNASAAIYNLVSDEYNDESQFALIAEKDATKLYGKAEKDLRLVIFDMTMFGKLVVSSVTTKLYDADGVSNIIADSTVVNNGNSDICLIEGSSLTYNLYSPKSLSWIERVNDLTDIAIVNGGDSGRNLLNNISTVKGGTIPIPDTTVLKLRPAYIVSNNDANGTPTGKSLDEQLKLFKDAVESNGAVMLLAGEEPTLIDCDKYTNQGEQTMDGINFIHTAEMWKQLNSAQSYKGWIDGSQLVHSNFKNGSSHVAIVEMLGKLPIRKSIKMYKVREGFKGGNPELVDLVYSNNEERAVRWRGLCTGIGKNASPWANDNIDGTGYIDNPSSYQEPMDESESTSVVSETTLQKFGTPITFFKYALIEAILPKINVTRCGISIECSVQPESVGAIIDNTYTELSFVYNEGVVSIDIDNDKIETYDKIRIIVGCPSVVNFTITIAEVVCKNGMEKPFDKYVYSSRKNGTELMTKTSVESGWTFAGNASVKSLPSSVQNYTTLNNVKSHIQLDDDSSSASYTQSLGKKVKKVAVRIAASIFPAIQTSRTSNDYTTTEQNIFRGNYYGGQLAVTINGAYKPMHIECGWMLLYTEAYINSDNLDITIGRITNVDENMNVGTFPVIIHDVSVQEI